MNASCDDVLWAMRECTQPFAAQKYNCCFPFDALDLPGNEAFCTFMMIVGVGGAFGNTLNLLALPYARYRCKKPHSPLVHSITLLVINLSVADLTFCLTILLNITSYWNHGWSFGQTSCVVVASAEHIAIAVSLATLSFIAINRGLGIWMPNVCDLIFKSQKGIPCLAIIWISSLVQFIPMWSDGSTYGYLGYNPRLGVCHYYDIIPPKSNYKYGMSAFVVVAPILFIAASGIAISVRVKGSKRDVESMGNSTAAKIFRKREQKLTIIFLTISGVYIACVAPFFLVLANISTMDYWSFWYGFAVTIFSANFAANCLLYAVRVPSYRRAYEILFMNIINTIRKFCLSPLRITQSVRSWRNNAVAPQTSSTSTSSNTNRSSSSSTVT